MLPWIPPPKPAKTRGGAVTISIAAINVEVMAGFSQI